MKVSSGRRRQFHLVKDRGSIWVALQTPLLQVQVDEAVLLEEDQQQQEEQVDTPIITNTITRRYRCPCLHLGLGTQQLQNTLLPSPILVWMVTFKACQPTDSVSVAAAAAAAAAAVEAPLPSAVIAANKSRVNSSERWVKSFIWIAFDARIAGRSWRPSFSRSMIPMMDRRIRFVSVIISRGWI